MSYAEGGIYAYDADEQIDAITELFQSNSETHGFVRRAWVERRYSTGEIKSIRRNGEIAGSVLYNHGTQKYVTTIYNLAAKEEHRGSGIREELLERTLRESPWNRAITKTPTGVAQNDFWREHGKKERVEGGKKRQLNVFRIDGDENTEQTESIL